MICENCGFSTTPSQNFANEKIVSILNVDLDEWNNIVIHDFSSRDHLGFRKPVRGYEFFQISKLSA